MARLILTLADVAAKGTGNTTGAAFNTGNMRDFVFTVQAVEVSGAGSLAPAIQHSFDQVNWFQNFAFDALTATGGEIKEPVLIPAPWVRARVGLDVGVWDYIIQMSANPLR